jgi:Cu(I)/Ag(I) efflux system membrane fusion protein
VCVPRQRNCAPSTSWCAAGRIEIDERRSFAISPKFEGYVERLHVNVTGQPVAKGQPLFEVYSPELVSAQREYTIAAQGVEALKDAGSEARSGMQQLAESSLLRLRNWDISEEQIRALATGASKRTLTFRSPVSGVVTEKKALQGMRFMPGDTCIRWPTCRRCGLSPTCSNRTSLRCVRGPWRRCASMPTRTRSSRAA